MTKKDFFRIMIKLFGLYAAILILFYQIPYLIQYSQIGFDFSSILFLVISTLAAIGLFLLLIFSADRIVQWLKLDRGFDDDQIDLKNLSLQSLVNFALILIGGFLIVDNVAIFLRQIYLALKHSASTNGISSVTNTFFMERVDYFTLFSSGLSILIGFLLLTNFTRIAEWILRLENSNSRSH